MAASSTPSGSKPSRRKQQPEAPPRWQWDWAGPHGTIWGTVNAVLTTISLTSAGHVWFHAPWWAAALAGAAGVFGVLVRAALRKTRTPGGTVLYQVACWSGAAGWSAWMLWRHHWTWWSWALGVVILAALALAAGIIAALASDELDKEEAEAANPTVAAAVHRKAKAIEWENRIARHLPSGKNDEVRPDIYGIEEWDGGHGFTGEGKLPEGGIGLDDLRAIAGKLAIDADLPHGCGVTFMPVEGGTRRQFLMDVALENGLSKDQDYPPTEPRSINDPLPVGVRPSFEEAAVELRSRNMLGIGETGSGKSNAEHVVIADVVQCVDAIGLLIDLTGAGLARPWLRPWLEGRTKRPAIGAVARDDKEAMRMCRAIIRGGYARKAAYQDLMAEVDDDKIPIGHLVPGDDQHIVPQVMLFVDEIANITGSRSQWPDLRDLIVTIINELRASGFRVVLAGLRATDDVVVQQIEAMCQIRFGLKVAAKNELAWLFDWSAGLDPAETPDPGCAFLQLDSAAKPEPIRFYRLKPSRIGEIAVTSDEWRCDPDPITRAAFNGRNPDGSRMAGVPDEDIDWWENRWDGWELGAPQPMAAEPQIPPVPPLPETSTPDAGIATLLANADAVDQELSDRIAEAQGLDQAAREERDRVRENFEELMRQEGFGEQDWNDPKSWSAPPTVEEAPANGPDRMLALLRAAGEAGLSPKEMLAALAGEGTVIHRDTLHDWLRKAASAGQVENRRRGRWVWVGGEPS